MLSHSAFQIFEEEAVTRFYLSEEDYEPIEPLDEEKVGTHQIPDTNFWAVNIRRRKRNHNETEIARPTWIRKNNKTPSTPARGTKERSEPQQGSLFDLY